MTLLFWLAILPSILLARRVLSYDKIEQEPFGLLAKLFVLGMLTCVPAGIIESIAGGILESIGPSRALESFVTYLVIVPFAEEMTKYVALRTTRKNPEFNYTFDGIVYGVMVGLGFATLENILYVLLNHSIQVAVMRGILSVPMHCTCGVFMGYYYGVAKGLESQGLPDRARTARLLSIAVPWLTHGLYDYALDLDSWIVLIAGFVFTFVVFILASRQVRFASAHDTPIVASFRQPDPDSLPTRQMWDNKGGRGPTIGF